MYKANDYKPIEFYSQGNVQEKIDKKLIAEMAMLNQLRDIENELSIIPGSKEGLGPDTLAIHLQTLSDLQSKLDSIKLYIRLNGKIREEIERKITSLL